MQVITIIFIIILFDKIKIRKKRVKGKNGEFTIAMTDLISLFIL